MDSSDLSRVRARNALKVSDLPSSRFLANLMGVLYLCLQMLLDTSSRFGQPPTPQRISALPNILRPST